MVSLEAESWTWFGIVTLIAISRFVSRRMTLGAFARFQTDDWLMATLLAFYTAYIPSINIVSDSDSNLLPPGFDVSSLTAQQIADREYGSKLILVVEQCQCVIVFGAKACLMILYIRLTTARWENVAIKALAAYIALGFVVMEVLYFAVWCRPFDEYWQVPTTSVQCSAATNHLITNAVFNLSSDLIMLAIGLPMFLRMRLPLKKKIPLVGVFSLGVFVVLAAILNKVYSFKDPFGSDWTYWYVREASTALLVGNLPFVWTFWRRVSGHHSTTKIGSVDPDMSRRSGRTMEQGLTDSKRSADGMEMAVTGPDMSLEDILAEDHLDGMGGKEISLYTHPQLYLAKQRQRAVTLTRTADPTATVEETVPDGRKIQFDDQDRRGSSAERKSRMSSAKSAGSFV